MWPRWPPSAPKTAGSMNRSYLVPRWLNFQEILKKQRDFVLGKRFRERKKKKGKNGRKEEKKGKKKRGKPSVAAAKDERWCD